MVQYIADKEHYSSILERAAKATTSLWIATADLKDLYVDRNGSSEPFLACLNDLISRGVEVRLLHAKEPGQPFMEDFDRFPKLWSGLQRRLCPRVHFKLLILDYQTAYIGSANMTGAGMGMKGENTRNFEAGLYTDNTELVDSAADHFERVWNGTRCSACRRKSFCGDKISQVKRKQK